jgi:uncharacterized damage-inducible protein DinB
LIASNVLFASLRRERAWTRRLVAAVPEEHFSWAPVADAFSCGGLVRHLLQSEVFWRRLIANIAAGRDYDPFGTLANAGEAALVAFRPRNLESSSDPRLGSSFAELLERWNAIEAETWQVLSGLDEAALDRQGRHPITGLALSGWEALLLWMSHEGHHRGQLSAYCKMLGVAQPPLFLPETAAGESAS